MGLRYTNRILRGDPCHHAHGSKVGEMQIGGTSNMGGDAGIMPMTRHLGHHDRDMWPLVIMPMTAM